VIDGDATVRCWGNDHFGQLGRGSRVQGMLDPGAKVVGLSGVRSIAVGVHHACALTVAGEVACWGAADSGQVGDGAPLPDPLAAADAPGPPAARTTPVKVKGLPGAVTAIDAGVSHTCAVLAGGGVACWGANEAGELGRPGPGRATAIVVPGVEDVLEVATGAAHTCARRADGQVLCWGRLASDGTPPTVVGGLCARQITAGSIFACAITCDGAPVCWGDMPGRVGSDGAVSGGAGSRDLAPAPGGLARAAEIRAGYWHVCTRDLQGALACWGGDDSGQLGSGNKSDWSKDFQMELAPVLATWGRSSALCAGGMSIRPDARYRRPSSFAESGATCALAPDDGVWCWGEPRLSHLPQRITSRR